MTYASICGFFLLFFHFCNLACVGTTCVCAVTFLSGRNGNFSNLFWMPLLVLIRRHGRILRCTRCKKHCAKCDIELAHFFLQFLHHCHHSLSCCQPLADQRARKMSTGWKNRRMRRAWSVSRPKALIPSTYWLMLPGKIAT